MDWRPSPQFSPFVDEPPKKHSKLDSFWMNLLNLKFELSLVEEYLELGRPIGWIGTTTPPIHSICGLSSQN